MKAVRTKNGALVLADARGLGVDVLDSAYKFGGRGQYEATVHTEISMTGFGTDIAVTYAGGLVGGEWTRFRTLVRMSE